jgi:hypothetical protein
LAWRQLVDFQTRHIDLRGSTEPVK